MAVNRNTLDRLRVTDERLVELTLAVALTLVAIAAVSWAVDGFYQSDPLPSALYIGAAVLGFALVVAIYHHHPVGLVGGILYFWAVVGDVLIQWSGFQDPLGLPGAVAFALVGSTALLLCRDVFFAKSDALG